MFTQKNVNEPHLLYQQNQNLLRQFLLNSLIINNKTSMLVEAIKEAIFEEEETTEVEADNVLKTEPVRLTLIIMT